MHENPLGSLLKNGALLRILEAVNGLEAYVAEHAFAPDSEGNQTTFDGLWLSGLCHAAAAGMPDDGRMPLSEKLTAVRTIRRVSQKPLLVDCDNGQGDFSHTARAYARAGVSGLVVEDKCGQKHNSLYGSARVQLLEDPRIFAQKLSDAKAHAPEILLFARLESLIAGQSMEDALERANLYAKAGADGIVIHSLDKTGGQVLDFCHRCKQLLPEKPVACIPTMYPQVSCHTLHQAGADMVIYANHLTRSAYKAMCLTAGSILAAGSSGDADQQYCAPTTEILRITEEAAHD